MSLQFKFTVPLKKEQKEGVRFLIKNRGAGLCFSTGLGKTLTSLVAAGYLVNNDVIDYVFVFHTKSATKAFHDDVTQNTTLNYNLVIESLELKPAPVVNLIQYNIADKVKDQILKISEKYKVAAIMDEIQVLKTYRGKLRVLYNSFRPHFDFVWGLTATPLSNHIEDLFSLTDYLIPGYFGTEFQFKDMYCEQVKRKTRRNGKKWVFYEIVGYKNLEHLKKKIEAVWLKRSERMPTDFIFKSVGKLTDDEEAQYLKAAKGILDESKELREFVTRLPSLQRAVDMSRTKQKALIQMLNELREQERGALIFFPFKEPLRAFLDLVDFPVKVMTGETSLLKRFEIQTYLKEHEFLFCTAAAARSLNLQIVDSVIFYTIPFELEIFMQMVGRVARPFVSKYEKVYITMLEVEDTIDVYRKELMKTNADLVNKLLDGDPNLPKDLAAKRRRVLIKLRKNLLWRIRK